MEIKITIPDEKDNAIVNAFAKQFYYSPKTWVEVDGTQTEIDNPQSKKQFMKEKINSFIKDVYRQSKVDEIDAQKAQAVEAADAESNLIKTI